MKKYQFGKTILSASIVCAVILSVTSLNSCNTLSAVKVKPQATTTTLTGMTTVATTVADYTNSRVQKAMVKATGVKVNWSVVSSDKLNVYLASGDLPDLLIVPSTYSKQLIQGNNSIAMDSLLKNTKSITKTIPKTLAISKKYWSNGKNKTYLIPVQVGTDGIGMEQYSGLVLRWDYYAQLGYPKINSIDDALTVINKMVKAHPTTANGKKVYGLSGWTDWGTWNYMYPMSAILGYYQTNSPTVELNVVTNKMINVLLDQSSPYWKSVEYYYKANQMGILDPDSFTQKNSDYITKATNGQYASLPATWASGDFNTNNVKNSKGYVVIPLTWGRQWGEAKNLMGYTDKCFTITKSCKHTAAAMKFIDYVYSYDGCRTMLSGVKGTDWNVKNGKASLTSSTLALSQAGGTKWSSTGIGYVNTFIGLSGFTVNTKDKSTLCLFNDPTTYAKTMNNLQKSFSKHYKVSYPNQIFKNIAKQGKVKTQSGENTLALALMPSETTDISRYDANLSSAAEMYGAKLSLAKNSTEFATIKAEALAAFKLAGSQAVFNWYNNNWTSCVKKAAQVK